MIEVIYQSEHFLVINKPAGLFVHDSNWSRMNNNSNEPKSENLIVQLKKQLKEGQNVEKIKLYPVHRLDRLTSGCLIVALTADWVSILQTSLQNAKKTYITLLTNGSFDDHKTPIDPDLNDEKPMEMEIENVLFKPMQEPISFIVNHPLKTSVL